MNNMEQQWQNDNNAYLGKAWSGSGYTSSNGPNYMVRLRRQQSVKNKKKNRAGLLVEPKRKKPLHPPGPMWTTLPGWSKN